MLSLSAPASPLIKRSNFQSSCPQAKILQTLDPATHQTNKSLPLYNIKILQPTILSLSPIQPIQEPLVQNPSTATKLQFLLLHLMIQNITSTPKLKNTPTAYKKFLNSNSTIQELIIQKNQSTLNLRCSASWNKQILFTSEQNTPLAYCTFSDSDVISSNMDHPE